MIGHLPLINLRMSGKAPKFISIEDHPSMNAHEWHEWDDSPVVCIAKTTSIPLTYVLPLA